MTAMPQGPAGLPGIKVLPRLSHVAAMLALVVLLAGLAGRQARAQNTEPGAVTILLDGGEMTDAMRRNVEALVKAGTHITIRSGTGDAAKPLPAKSGAALPVPAPVPEAEDASALDHTVATFVEGFNRGNAALPAIAGLPADFATAWTQRRNSESGLEAALRVLAVLGVALALGVLARRIVAARLAFLAPRHMPPGEATALPFSLRLRAGLLRGGADLVGLAVFTAAQSLCVGWLLPQADFAREIAVLVAQSLAVSALYFIAGHVLLAPGEPGLRLLALPRAERHFRLLLLYGVVGAFTIASIGLASRVASNVDENVGWFTLWGLLLLIIKLGWFWDARHDTEALILSGAPRPEAPNALRRVVAALAPYALMATALAIWSVSRAAIAMADGVAWGRAAGITQLVVVLVPILAEGATQFTRCVQRPAEGDTPRAPLTVALHAVLEKAAGGLVWILGILLLGRVWSVYLLDSMSRGNTALAHLTAVAVVVVAGWIVLVFAKAFFDASAPAPARGLMPGEEDEGDGDHVPSRLATVLPVIRGVSLGAIVGLTALAALAKLGIDTGPLLAGFGILGLAISFGSQALVRDIVSGIFFMVEDAFRVGEYIDTGKLKGTVEKISLRSIVLRHQSGQIHTVPFGQIPSVTNASRDWATIKFNLRLDHSADIEKARKTIKKVGIAMAEEPEFASQIIMPVKMQGVSDITDNAVIVRLKFTAKPAQASLLQREALRRIYRALNEAGVPFASSAVTVRSSEEHGMAGAAAAQSLASHTALEPVG